MRRRAAGEKCSARISRTGDYTMTTEVLDIESKRHSGFERYIVSAVTITDEIVDFPADALDRRGRDVVGTLTEEFEVVLGIARITWKSREDREKCIEDQRRRSRWADVEFYA